VLRAAHERPLVLLCETVDASLRRRDPELPAEFRVHGERYRELNHGHPFSRTSIHCEDPEPIALDAAWVVEVEIEKRFGAPPYIALYRNEQPDRPQPYAIHVSPGAGVDSLAFAGRMRSLRDRLTMHRDIDAVCFVLDGKLLERGSTEPRHRVAEDLFHEEEFSPHLPRM
jgi:hypothetical protein